MALKLIIQYILSFLNHPIIQMKPVANMFPLSTVRDCNSPFFFCFWIYLLTALPQPQGKLDVAEDERSDVGWLDS